MFQELNEGISFRVKVVPKSSSNRLAGWENDELRICLKAIPEKGKANAELVNFLALYLHVGKKNVCIMRGLTSRHKQVCIQGITISELKKKLL